MDSKSPLHSKTVLFNALIALAGVLGSFGLVPNIQSFLQNNASVVLGSIGVVGIILRLVTSGKVSLFDQN